MKTTEFLVQYDFGFDGYYPNPSTFHSAHVEGIAVWTITYDGTLQDLQRNFVILKTKIQDLWEDSYKDSGLPRNAPRWLMLSVVEKQDLAEI